MWISRNVMNTGDQKKNTSRKLQSTSLPTAGRSSGPGKIERVQIWLRKETISVSLQHPNQQKKVPIGPSLNNSSMQGWPTTVRGPDAKNVEYQGSMFRGRPQPSPVKDNHAPIYHSRAQSTKKSWRVVPWIQTAPPPTSLRMASGGGLSRAQVQGRHHWGHVPGVFFCRPVSGRSQIGALWIQCEQPSGARDSKVKLK